MKFHQLRSKAILVRHVLILVALVLFEGAALNHAVGQDASGPAVPPKMSQRNNGLGKSDMQTFYNLARDVSSPHSTDQGSDSASEAPHAKSSSSLSFDWCAAWHAPDLFACWAACRVEYTPDYCTSYCAYLVCKRVRACRGQDLEPCERHNPHPTSSTKVVEK